MCPREQGIFPMEVGNPGGWNVVDKHWTEWKSLELWGWVASESLASQWISSRDHKKAVGWSLPLLSTMVLLAHLTRDPQPPLCRFVFVSSIWSHPFLLPKEPFEHFEY